MALIDFCKAFDNVPRIWILTVLDFKTARIRKMTQVINFICKIFCEPLFTFLSILN